MVEQVAKKFPPDIFHRAVNYLYTKETRSSYQIEYGGSFPERRKKQFDKLTNEEITEMEKVFREIFSFPQIK